MTDITELAQSLKAAAEKATPGPWGVARDGKTLVSNQSHPIATLADAMHRMLADGSTGKDAEFIALANPANILALVEALEKAQRANAAQDDHINQQQDRINRLEKRNSELGKHVRMLEKRLRGTEESLIAATDMVSELESRTVTPVTYSENADADHCRKWAWEQVKGEVLTEEWTTGDNITYFGFFCWGWDMRRQYNEQRPVTVNLPRPGFVTISGERTAVYLKDDVDAALATAGIREGE
ncbi:TPA: ead/Ea22-like family protein [Raoultella ornithinolytica]|uniref:Ead/Ea22-like family protein n=1 Tax=Raoultella ornithinolytica TaxID=54291 RepID=A0ABZ2DS31_RAOOR|nr:ead/Ea22-like family protein [Raoultella ornithinolytica]